MTIRRDTPQDSAPKSASPHDMSDKGSLIWRLNRFIENVFSHKGMFWLGVAIALISFIGNLKFYNTLLSSAELTPWQSALGAFGLSFGTCLFEVMPIVWARSNRVNLNQIFAAGAKPNQLPVLDERVVGNAEELIAAYRDGDRKSTKFFRTMRYVAIGAEVFMGLLFLGRIATGVKGLLNLLMFVGSIFGVEWGVSLAVRAGQWELPPNVRKQLNDLLGNGNRPLDLQKINR